MLLKENEKLSIVYDTSNDQPERFPNGYFIIVILAYENNNWVNTGRVYHAAKLAEMDEILFQ